MSERRSNGRVGFARGVKAYMMAIDGTWRRSCSMEDISDSGVRLFAEEGIENLHIKEFFLVLSSTGLAYRRCELAWVNGDQIGARFVKSDPGKGSGKRRSGGVPEPEAAR